MNETTKLCVKSQIEHKKYSSKHDKRADLKLK